MWRRESGRRGVRYSEVFSGVVGVFYGFSLQRVGLNW